MNKYIAILFLLIILFIFADDVMSADLIIESDCEIEVDETEEEVKVDLNAI